MFSLTHVPQSAEGWVYVMECAGYYKIGWSRSPNQRLAGVQTSCPLPVTLVGVFEGSMATEAEWHLAFRDKRVNGEWFALTDEDVSRVLHEYDGIDRIPGDDEIA